MATLAISLAGAAAGFAVGGPFGAQVGFTGGLLVANQIFREEITNEGPRIEDAQVTTSAYGALLPTVYGIYPVAGNIIDASPVREVVKKSSESQGKGGGPEITSKTYSYFGDLAVAICEGTIGGLLQIRANGQIIYDATSTAEVVKPDWLKYTLYTGTETQNPDSILEVIHGAGNVPAYRGTAYIVFEDFAFSQFGNQFAINFEFLVAISASNAGTLEAVVVSPETVTQYSGGLREPATSLLMFPLSNTSAQTYGVAAIDPHSREVVWQSGNNGTQVFLHISLKPKIISVDGGSYAVPGEIAVVTGGSDDNNYIITIDAESGQILEQSNLKESTGTWIRSMVYDWFDTNPNATPYFTSDRGSFNGIDLQKGFSTTTIIDEITDWYFQTSICSNGAGKILVSLANAEISATNWGVAVLDTSNDVFSDVVELDEAVKGMVWADDSWWVITDTDPCYMYEISEDGNLLNSLDFDNDYGVSYTGDQYLSYSETDNSIYYQTSNTLNKLKLYALDEAPTQWSVARSDSLTLFDVQTCRAWYGPISTEDEANSINVCALSGSNTTLDVVVSDLSINGTELVAADIDVTALASTTVRGMGIGRAMPRRNAITMLQAAYAFDYVPRNGKLVGVLRGGASSATLTEDEIGAHLYGSEAPEPWIITRSANNQLPEQVEVTFVDPEHNYEPGTQLARRQAQSGGTTERIQLALSLTNDEGVEIAETTLHGRHINAEQYSSTTMPSTIDDVQPAAVLTTVFDGISYQYRVLNGNVIDGRAIELSAVREVPEVYTNYAVGGSPRTPEGTVKALGTTLLWPIDTAMLRSQDDNTGLYLAAASFTTGWPGCEIDRATDGVNYSPVTSIPQAATMGNATNGPTTGAEGHWDTTTSLVVSLIAGTLTNTTRDAPSYAVWGQAGRWELVAFTTVSQDVSSGDWTITEIARGLLDTGSAISSHVIGDRFVVLDEDALDRILLPVSSIDQLETLRAVTFGRLPSTAAVVAYQYTGENLEPFAPTRLDGSIDGSDNWDLSWMRQDRKRARPFWQASNSESTETYTLQILDELDAVVREITVTDATTYEYTSATQITDFGKNQTTLRWQVAQVSANTGDGHFAYMVSGINYDYSGVIVADGANAYFTLDEESGTTANDAVGSFDGTINGTPTMGVTGLMRTGKALDFDGSDDYVSWDSSVKATSWIRSIEFAFNITAFPSSGSDCLMSQTYTFSPSLSFYVLIGSDLKLRLILYTTSSTQVLNIAGANLSTATDYHVIINWGYSSGATCEIYVNDALYASGTTSNSWQLTSASSTLAIGIDGAGTSYTNFNGVVDNVSFWTSEQDATQRSNHFDRGGIA